MIYYSFFEYVRYLLISKTRHGIHSPFVYEFADTVLKNRIEVQDDDPVKKFKELLPKFSGFSKDKYWRIIELIVVKYNYSKIELICDEANDFPSENDLVLIGTEPKIWIRIFNHYLPELNKNGCIAIADIHKTKRHARKWNIICKHPKVKLSIDLFGLGLLFTKDEIREKQNFVLRY